MKTRFVLRICTVGLALAASCARGQFAVAIAVDAPAEVRWVQEVGYWNRVISGIEREISRTDELIRLMGDTKASSARLAAPSASLLKPVEQALALDSRDATLKTANQRFHLSSVATPTYNGENKVAPQYAVFGETQQRDKTRYSHFALQEAMNARHKRAADNTEVVEKHELEVQRNALDSLRRVKTHAEASIIQGVIAASQQRVEMAHAKLTQAGSELEVFRGQIAFEDARKAEADREWTEAVVSRMRDKALAGYRAQMGSDRSSR